MYNGPYLRVLTPRTSDGISPLIGADDRVEYKEAHLPLSAKLAIETQNAKLPVHLRKKIEVVPGYQEPVKQSAESLTDEQLRAQLEKLLELSIKRGIVVQSEEKIGGMEGSAQSTTTEVVAPTVPKTQKAAAPATPNLNKQQ